MKWLRFTILLVAVAVINAGDIMNIISIGRLGIRPEILVSALVFFAGNCGTSDALIASFAIGFAADISGWTMGPYMISYGLLGSLLSGLRKVLIIKKLTSQALTIFTVYLSSEYLVRLLTSLKTNEPSPLNFAVLFLTAGYSALAGLLLWRILSFLAGWLGIKRPRLGK